GTLRVAGFTGPAPRALESAALKLGESAERWVEDARRELGTRVAPSPAGVLFRHPFDPRIAVALPIVAGGKFFGVLGFSSSLREPLRAVEGFCEMFRAEFAASVPEAGQKILERIWAGAGRMTRLINDLLHFSRFGRQPLTCARVPLREVVEQCVARLEESRDSRRP